MLLLGLGVLSHIMSRRAEVCGKPQNTKIICCALWRNLNPEHKVISFNQTLFFQSKILWSTAGHSWNVYFKPCQHQYYLCMEKFYSMPLSLPLFMLFLAEFPTCGRRVSSTASCVSASNSLITKSQYTRSDIECLDKCRDGFPSDCSSAYRDQHGNVFS